MEKFTPRKKIYTDAVLGLLDKKSGMCLGCFLASQSNALISGPTQRSNPKFPTQPIHPTYSSEACLPIYIKDRKSFKNSNNALWQSSMGGVTFRNSNF